MLKRLVLLFVALIALLASVRPVQAYQAPVTLYVDAAYTGSEDGSQQKPYNTINEAIAVAQSQPGGGLIFVKQSDGTYKFDRQVDSVKPGQTGLPLARPVLYGLLAFLSLILILAGWQFQRRSRRLQS